MTEPLNNYSKEEISTFWGILYSITDLPQDKVKVNLQAGKSQRSLMVMF